MRRRWKRRPREQQQEQQQMREPSAMATASRSGCRSSSRLGHSSRSRSDILLLLVVFFSASTSAELPPSQVRSLLRLPRLMEYPAALSPLIQGGNDTGTTTINLCSLASTTTLSIACDASAATVVGLTVLGDKPAGVKLSSAFSMESLGNILWALPDVETLALVQLGLWGSLPGKLDQLQALRSLNLSHNAITGTLPSRLSSLQRLETLDLSSNTLDGTLPPWLGSVSSLKDLDLSNNQLSGQVPAPALSSPTLERLSIAHNSLSGSLPASAATSLRFLNAGANQIGPAFPSLGPALEWVLLGNNKITGPFSAAAANLSNVVVLSLAYNRLSGGLPVGLLHLPSIRSLSLNANQLGGTLPANLSFSPSLRLLDVSSNFFSGRPPQAFLDGSAAAATTRVVFVKNCFTTTVQRQYRRSHCDAALAAAAARPPPPPPQSSSHDMALIIGLIGGGIALLATVTLFLCVLIRCLCQEKRYRKKDKGTTSSSAAGPSSAADTASLGVPSDLLSNARYLSQSIRLGVLGTPQGKVFSVAELEEATASFSGAAVIGEGQHGRVFKGKLQDGTPAAVKCLLLDARQDLRQLKAHVELLVKVRHRHLVSYYGYCIDTTATTDSPRLFLVSELLDNGTLRTHLSKTECSKDFAPLTWPQRLAAVIGAGRGIQFLHTGVVPGIFNNDVSIDNVLMDMNQVAKLTDFGLGRHARTSCDFDAKLYVRKTAAHIDLDHHRRKLASDKADVYNFGFILLEMVLGRPPTIDNSKASGQAKIRELEMLTVENVPRFEVIDPSIAGVCVAESLSTVLEIAAKCVNEDASSRPSMEDVLWNLQYAAQVQDRVSGEYSEELPYVSPPRTRFSRQAMRTSSSSSWGRRPAAIDELLG